jgi:FkbM family methyltransferase
MSLEEFGKTWIAKAGFKLCATTLKLAAVFHPEIPYHFAKKMRGLFSTRLNNILHENIFVYRNVAPKVCITPRDIFCHTGLELNLNLDIQDYTQGHFYFAGLPNFFLDLVAFINERTVFFDLGANMGIISASLAKFLPHRQIIAVEAMPETYQRLKKVFDSNCPTASAFNTALSSSSGKLLFNIPSTDSGSSSASLSAKELLDARNPKVQIQTIQVDCERFENFYARIDFGLQLSKFEKHAFKIDVEGHEVELLHGMTNYFNTYFGEIMIIVEVRPTTCHEVFKILLSNRFLINKDLNQLNPEAPLRDLIFTRSSTLI